MTKSNNSNNGLCYNSTLRLQKDAFECGQGNTRCKRSACVAFNKATDRQKHFQNRSSRRRKHLNSIFNSDIELSVSSLSCFISVFLHASSQLCFRFFSNISERVLKGLHKYRKIAESHNQIWHEVICLICIFFIFGDVLYSLLYIGF